MLRQFGRSIPAVLLLTSAAEEARAQDTTNTSIEARASRARRGGGINISTWALVDDPATGSAKSSDSPLAEGYFGRGIDKHLAFETSIGIFRRQITVPPSGGIGGSPGGTTSAILLPQMTSLKLYPFTSPDSKFEPFISAGAGFVLGFISESGGGGLLGGSGGSSGLATGVGATTSAGVEWRLSQAFGLMAGGHYTYLQFFEEVAGEKMYRGTGVRAGISYRFQY